MMIGRIELWMESGGGASSLRGKFSLTAPLAPRLERLACGSFARQVSPYWSASYLLLVSSRDYWSLLADGMKWENLEKMEIVQQPTMPPADSSHRPRKKTKGSTSSAVGSNDAVIIDPSTTTLRPAFPLASFLWPARKSASQWVILPLVLMMVGLFRWVTGFWGYSGLSMIPTRGFMILLTES